MRSERREVTQKPAMIIAPHPDDEVLGCGGLIARKRAEDTGVSVVYLTDGESAHKDCCITAPAEIASARRSLAAAAGELLGLREDDMSWLHLPDGGIPRRDAPEFGAAVAGLAALMKRIQPQEVYAPHFLDYSTDHEAAIEIVQAALNEVDHHCELFYYSVWMWRNLRLRDLGLLRRWKTLRIDIGSLQARKQGAIRRYLDPVNPACGISFCCRLPEDFLDPFQGTSEIFFQERVNEE
jgi:LmbE family N-acetylglucosaminyl deacetylase